MMASGITALRRATRFLRSMAVVVCVAFTMLILTPTVVAARQLTDEPASSVALASSDEAKFSRTLARLEHRLEKLEKRLHRRLDAALDVKDVKKLKRRLKRLDTRLVRNFDKVRRFIERKQLPVEILLRHETMVATYQAELHRLIGVLSDVETRPDAGARLQAVRAALTQLRAKPHTRSQQPFDPQDLPNQGLQPNPDNTPKAKPAAFTRAGLHSNPLMRVAALGEFTYDLLPGASDPAYLAATTEVTLSEAITAKAAELHHDPIQIHNWVRNHIEWLPSWGAYQSADLTLSSRRGNAMDISSLLIALLRVAHIPARYVHGTIELPAEAFTNWAGDFATVDAAIDFVSAGGIPVTPVLSGGRISKVRLEHLWVEAAIDFQPSRGAVNKAADSWIALDASFKQYDYQEGLDVLSIAGIDPEQLGQSFVDSATVNEAESWVTGFDGSILETAQTQAQSAVQQYIEDNLSEPTVGEIIGGRRTIVKDYLVLPSGLPYKPLVTGARYGALPEALQHRMSLAFARDILGDLMDPITLPWAKVNNQKLTLSFDPATDADQEALAALLPDEITDVSQIPYSIPAYLIRVVPVLRLNGHIIHQGNSVNLGEEVSFSFDVIDPGQGRRPYTSPVIAGSYLAVPVVAGSLSPLEVARTKARMEKTRAALDSRDMTRLEALTRDDILGDVFYLGGLGYFAHYDAFAYFTARPQRMNHLLASSAGTFGYEPEVSYFFGLPRAIEPGGLYMDMDRVARVIGPHEVDPAQRKAFNLQAGMLSSALEHAVPELLFDDPDTPETPNGISAVKALALASQQGQRVYHLTAHNQATILPSIHHHPDTLDEIRTALSAGKEVITHTDAVSVPGWSGAGYIIFDPETGDAAYKISGGRNGGQLDPDTTNFMVNLVTYQSLALDLKLMLMEGAGKAAVLTTIKTLSKAFAGIGIFADLVGLLANLADVAANCSDPTIVLGFGIAIAGIAMAATALSVFAFGAIPFVGWIAMYAISQAINLRLLPYMVNKAKASKMCW